MKNSCNQKTSARNYETFRTGLPGWFKQEIPSFECLDNGRRLVSAGVNTVCVEAKCPNLSLCFKQRKLTFMILGPVCTRSCRFCAVDKSKGSLSGPDKREPLRIAEAIKNLNISYAVITSVCRDDLDDGGASQFSDTVEAIRKINPAVLVEILIPDFQGRISALKSVLQAGPVVIGHNIETVSRLYRYLRPEADYRRSLELLKILKQLDGAIVTKSSLMLGLSESEDEVISTMKDLRLSGCDILTLGQYLAPSPDHEQINEFVSLERFAAYRKTALALGFKSVLSGPLVRSSFEAEQTYRQSCS
jgi:lipoyl synthase